MAACPPLENPSAPNRARELRKGRCPLALSVLASLLPGSRAQGSESRAGRAGWRPPRLGSGSYRSAAGRGGQGGRASECRGEASSPPPRGKGLGRAGSQPARAAAPWLATERDAPPAASYRPACRRRSPHRPGPGGRPGRSSLHPPPAHSPAPPPRSTWGGRGHGVVPWEKLRSPAPASGSKQHGDKLGRRTRPGKFGAAPGERRAHPAPAASEPPDRGRWFISEVTPRRPEGAARPIRHERGFLQLPRRPLSPRLPKRRPRRSPHAAPGPCPLQAQGWAGDRLSGCRGGRRAPGPRSGEHPRPRPPGARLSRGPRRTPAPARTAGTRGRGGPVVYIRRPPAATVLVCTPKTKAEAAPRVRSPRQGRPDRVSQHPEPRTAAARSPHPQPQPGWARSPTPEARGSRAMEGAPAPRAGLRAAAAEPGRLRCSAGPASGRAPRVPRPPAHTPAPLAPPLPLAPASPRPCRPQAASRSAGAGWMQRCPRRGPPEPTGEAPESPRGRVRAPPAPGTAPRRPGFRAARAGGGNSPGARRRATAAGGTRRSPRSSSPARRAPAPARCPAPGARALSPPPPRSRRSDRGAAAAAVPAGPAPPARLRRRDRRPAPGARPSRPAARSLGPLRPPASQPPAPLFRALETAGEAARPPRRGPARRPAPALAGLTRALKAPRPPRRAAPRRPPRAGPRLATRTARPGTGRESGARVRRRCRRHSVKVWGGVGRGGQEKAQGFPPPKPGHPFCLSPTACLGPRWQRALRSVLCFGRLSSSPDPDRPPGRAPTLGPSGVGLERLAR